MNSLEKITKLMDQYKKELELVEKHKQKAKSLADEIRRQKGEEFNERIDKLKLTVEQFDRVLKLLDRDNKAQLLDAIGMVASPDAAHGNTDGAETEEKGIQQKTDPVGTGTDDTESEVPVFGEEGDEKAS